MNVRAFLDPCPNDLSNSTRQDHVFGLQSLPNPDDYERLKEKRQKELLREIEAQRQAELEAKRLAASRLDEVSCYMENLTCVFL